MFQFNKPPLQRPAKPARKFNRPNPAKKEDLPPHPLFHVFGLFTVAAVTTRLLIGSAPVAEVGDTAQFGAGSMTTTAADMDIPARLIAGPWDRPGRSCTLNVAEMSAPGGVMTVSAVRRDGVILSWAGRRTADAKTDCGEDAEVLVTDDDYGRLLRSQVLQQNLRMR